MNPSHYPSLELCKKLHSIWMRWVWEYWYAEWQCVNGVWGDFTKTEFTSKESFYNIWKRKSEWGKWMSLSWIFIESYSVMEMLDVIPGEINEYYLSIVKQHDWKYDLCYQELYVSWELYKIEWSLPDILAQTIIYLYSGNYISFTK